MFSITITTKENLENAHILKGQPWLFTVILIFRLNILENPNPNWDSNICNLFDFDLLMRARLVV